jgi:hypothetical protein
MTDMNALTQLPRLVAQGVSRNCRAVVPTGIALALLALVPGCSSSSDGATDDNRDGGGGLESAGSGAGTASGGSGTPSSGSASSSVGGAGLGVGRASGGGRANGTGGVSQSSGGTNPGTGVNGMGGTAPGGAGAGGAGTGGKPNTGGTGGAGTGGKPSTGGAGGAGTGGKPSTGGAAGTGGATSNLDKELFGVYCGNTPSDVTQFEGWVGRHVDGILGYTGNASWADYDGSVGWAVGNWSVLDRRVLWSVPLIPTGATLADAAAGKYDDHYKKAAQTLATYRTQEPVLYVRTGWEFNGNWFPWNAQGKAKDFAGAFQHFVMAFRGVSNRFRIEWNVNVGDVGMNPEDAYPGDSYVDIIGMDFYWNTQWDPTDPAQAWTSMLTRKYGLNWHQDFAKAHGKPTAYSEWGVMSNNGVSYVQQAKAWFASHDVVYQTYWNSDSAFTGKLSSGQYPATGAAYKTAFGQ